MDLFQTTNIKLIYFIFISYLLLSTGCATDRLSKNIDEGVSNNYKFSYVSESYVSKSGLLVFCSRLDVLSGERQKRDNYYNININLNEIKRDKWLNKSTYMGIPVISVKSKYFNDPRYSSSQKYCRFDDSSYQAIEVKNKDYYKNSDDYLQHNTNPLVEVKILETPVLYDLNYVEQNRVYLYISNEPIVDGIYALKFDAINENITMWILWHSLYPISVATDVVFFPISIPLFMLNNLYIPGR